MSPTFVATLFGIIIIIVMSGFLGSKKKGSVSFEPSRDVPSLAGKVILITGGSGGLGRQAAIEFARHDAAHIYIAGTPRADGGAAAIGAVQEAVPGARISFLELDLGSLDSVRKAAEKFSAAEDRLDICVLNAGVMPVKAGMTANGYERAFGINYLGHALLTRLLMPTLLRTAEERGADVRIIVITSEAHAQAPRGGILFEKLKTRCEDMSFFRRYGQSKLACVLLARELARRYPQLKAVAVHPGSVVTGMVDIFKKESLLARLASPLAPLLLSSVDIGVRNHLWASTANVQSGKYYEPVGIPDKESLVARDENLAGKLWEWTSNELKG